MHRNRADEITRLIVQPGCMSEGARKSIELERYAKNVICIKLFFFLSTRRTCECASCKQCMMHVSFTAAFNDSIYSGGDVVPTYEPYTEHCSLPFPHSCIHNLLARFECEQKTTTTDAETRQTEMGGFLCVLFSQILMQIALCETMV